MIQILKIKIIILIIIETFGAVIDCTVIDVDGEENESRGRGDA